jgi:hypothetical protein
VVFAVVAVAVAIARGATVAVAVESSGAFCLVAVFVVVSIAGREAGTRSAAVADSLGL